MSYYIDTIEQVKGETEGSVNEYGKREKKGDDLNVTLAAFYTKLANVSNDIGEGKNHYFMDIRIVDSTGGVIKKDRVGKLVEVVTPVEEEPAAE